MLRDLQAQPVLWEAVVDIHNSVFFERDSIQDLKTCRGVHKDAVHNNGWGGTVAKTRNFWSGAFVKLTLRKISKGNLGHIDVAHA